MSHNHGKNVMTAAGLVATMFLAPAVIARWQHPTPPPPQPRQSPNAPTNQNVPQGLEGQPNSVEPRSASLNPQTDQELRESVQRLYTMASELKAEVDRTNSNLVLNVSLVKRAHEIERLAKQIKDRAKQ